MWFCNNIMNFYRPIEQIKKIVIATANCNRTEYAMLTMHIFDENQALTHNSCDNFQE